MRQYYKEKAAEKVPIRVYGTGREQSSIVLPLPWLMRDVMGIEKGDILYVSVQDGKLLYEKPEKDDTVAEYLKRIRGVRRK
jgi:bifunctional DNA-binding transcriptional regulator/antitoxin component of YhaV-PrlF toxin-antitoxin module